MRYASKAMIPLLVLALAVLLARPAQAAESDVLVRQGEALELDKLTEAAGEYAPGDAGAQVDLNEGLQSILDTGSGALWGVVRKAVRSGILLLTVVLLFTFAVRVMRVDGPSMRETLQDGDLLLVVNRLLSGAPDTGEIVIVRKESFESGEAIVKRVIATAGQTVDIDFDGGTVYVDGAALEEPYIRQQTHREEGTVFPLTVPEGCVFVMGDNRNDSRDSRDPVLGPVDTRAIIGRAVFLLLPGQTEDLEAREWSRIGILK